MIIFVRTIIFAFIASLLSTFLAETHLTERVAILGSTIGLQLSHNPGVAFGIAIPEPWQSLLIGAALLLLLWVAWQERRGTVKQIAFGLIIGGALGNVADRLGDGLVTDFFQVGSFPVFNVADSCVTVGMVLLILATFLHRLRYHSENTCHPSGSC